MIVVTKPAPDRLRTLFFNFKINFFD